MIDAPLSQRVVIYDSGRGRGLVYDTAYSEKQIERATKNCATRHGRRRSNARSVLAAEAK